MVLPALKVTHLTRIGSDHAPLLLRLDETPPYKSRFIFQRMWSEHPDFLRVVKEAWVMQVAGSPSQRLPSKLKILKFKLKNWNWEVFGDIRHKLAMLQEMIVQNEEVVQQAWSNEVEEELHQLKKDLQQVLRWDEELLYQKTREKWISEGDKNSKFFHALIRVAAHGTRFSYMDHMIRLYMNLKQSGRWLWRIFKISSRLRITT